MKALFFAVATALILGVATGFGQKFGEYLWIVIVAFLAGLFG